MHSTAPVQYKYSSVPLINLLQVQFCTCSRLNSMDPQVKMFAYFRNSKVPVYLHTTEGRAEKASQDFLIMKQTNPWG